MAKNHWTYFNDPYKFRKVDEFCAWYLNGNAGKVRVTNTVTKTPTVEDVLTFIRLNRSKFTEISGGRYQLGGDYYNNPTFRYESGYIKDLDKDEVPDPRFVGLKDLIHRWADIIKTDGDTKEALVGKLWPLIALLSEDNRIDQGKGFRLENYGESEYAHMHRALDNVEARVANLEKNPILKKGIPR